MNGTTFNRFAELAETGEIVPVYKELIADLETPISVLKKFANEENVFLLESVEGGERFGRYSFIGVNPHHIFKATPGKAQLIDKFGTATDISFENYPLEALRQILGGKKMAEVPELPPLPGGAIGYVAYESVNSFENLPPPKGESKLPDAMFLITDEIIVFDNIRHTLKVIVCTHPEQFANLSNAYNDAQFRIEQLLKIINTPLQTEKVHTANPAPPLPQPEMTKENFCKMVENAKEYIKQGEVIQIVLSQRFCAPLVSEPVDIYRALRLINPSPYTFFLKTGELILVGSSPETMIKLTGNISNLRPIAGSRKRGKNENEDRNLADELLKDEKETAEHLMLVDLGRNDLGRTAAPGSVQLKSFMNVERYSHVMHLVSDVEAVMDKKFDALDLLKTTFPAGTLSGAPKIRAMELINELESQRRGVYGGSVGYLSYDGNMDMAITIRTIEIRNGKMFMQSGAGIVFDSIPEMEYEETLNKAGALFKAIKVAAEEFSKESTI